MTINDEDKFVNALWDWKMFNGCFGQTHISPTDVDGLVERKGKFLVLESKAKDVPIKTGQEITFNSLINTGLFSVLVMWGEKNKPEKALFITKEKTKEYESTNVEECRGIVKDWFASVDTPPKENNDIRR